MRASWLVVLSLSRLFCLKNFVTFYFLFIFIYFVCVCMHYSTCVEVRGQQWELAPFNFYVEETFAS